VSAKTGIEWTDATWNPIRGCSPVSPGCKNCYASKVAMRFSGPGQPYEGLVRINAAGERTDEWNGVVLPVERHLLDPLRWKPILRICGFCYGGCGEDDRDGGSCKCENRPRRIFVNSMSDLFHENLPDEEIDRVFAVMALRPEHTFQVLTKRPERMLHYFQQVAEEKDMRRWINAAYEIVPYLSPCAAGMIEDSGYPLPNVWLGISVENQKYADERIPLLLRTPAAARFISAEPLLGPVDLSIGFRVREGVKQDVLYGSEGLRWVIAGGESGPGARPMHPDWARSLRDQCQAADVAFFFKQWGEWTPGENVERSSGVVETATWFDGRWIFEKENLASDEGHRDDEPDLYRMGKKAAGAWLDGQEWKQFPEVPA
jgi:protein gp37